MLEKMKEIIAEQLGVEEDEITPDTSFKEDLGADSLVFFFFFFVFFFVKERILLIYLC